MHPGHLLANCIYRRHYCYTVELSEPSLIQTHWALSVLNQWIIESHTELHSNTYKKQTSEKKHSN